MGSKKSSVIYLVIKTQVSCYIVYGMDVYLWYDNKDVIAIGDVICITLQDRRCRHCFWCENCSTRQLTITKYRLLAVSIEALNI